jgi:hypothetical protein
MKILSLQNLCQLFYGMLGAVLISILVHCVEESSQHIGTVNITGMIDQFIKQETQNNLSPGDLRKEVKNYGIHLNQELQKFSKSNHVVLLPSEAVIAGTHDYTGLINQKIQSLYQTKQE